MRSGRRVPASIQELSTVVAFGVSNVSTSSSTGRPARLPLVSSSDCRPNGRTVSLRVSVGAGPARTAAGGRRRPPRRRPALCRGRPGGERGAGRSGGRGWRGGTWRVRGRRHGPWGASAGRDIQSGRGGVGRGFGEGVESSQSNAMPPYFGAGAAPCPACFRACATRLSARRFASLTIPAALPSACFRS